MPSTTVENYLKQIYLRQQEQPAESPLAPMGKIAAAMDVAPGTATAMVKTLAEAGLAHYEPRGGARLTQAGAKLALQVLRRHRLIELFLVEVVGLDWFEVHDEAEELEHAISEKVLEKIDALLGHPGTDPHGDPIPPPAGSAPTSGEHAAGAAALADAALADLTDCPTTQPLRLRRVLDQDPVFLRFLDEHGLTPGARLVVEPRQPAADAVTVRPAGHPSVALGPAAAEKILVSDEEGGAE